MIKQFKFKNFRSFKEETILAFDKNNKIITLYGANASGKSNFYNAFFYFRDAVRITEVVKNTEPPVSGLSQPSSSWTVSNLRLSPFKLNKESSESTTDFEIIFDISKDVEYTYGFSVSVFDKKIIKEYLIEKAVRNIKRTERKIFERNLQDFTGDISSNIELIKNRIREDILVLPHLLNENIKEAKDVHNYISKIEITDSNSLHILEGQVFNLLENKPEIKERVLSALSSMDYFIKDFDFKKPDTENLNQLRKAFPNFSLEDLTKFRQIGTLHNTYDNTGKILQEKSALDLMREESLGTQKAIIILTLLFNSVLNKSNIIIFDEFGSSFHPNMTREFIRMFKQFDIQFILCTHETALLSKDADLNRESIWFVEKNSKEESELFCLKNIEGVRVYKGDSAAVDKQYLEGRFGAVPYIVEQDYNEHE